MLAANAADHGLTSTRSRMHIVMSLRKALKPECISATMDRAHARAARSAGHIPGWRSARYSPMARESHTCAVPSCSAGTSAVGENARLSALYFPVRPMGTSRNGAPDSFAASQPRNDHDE
jgi:hypothetical protein